MGTDVNELIEAEQNAGLELGEEDEGERELNGYLAARAEERHPTIF